MRAQRLEDLDAYRLCEDLAKAIEAATASVTDRRFCEQINDAALDATSDVAEGFARYYPGEFARFLDFAIASLEEVRVRTTAGYRRKYFSAETASDLLHQCLRASNASRSLRAYLWSVNKKDLAPRPDRSKRARELHRLRKN